MLLRGLYAITDPALLPSTELVPAVEAALRGGAAVIQYRDKHASSIEQHARAHTLRSLCARYNALFIVNDDIALALAVDADGVHLGQADGDLRSARQRLGNKLLGVTCHGDMQLAYNAALLGADYLAFGRFYDSPTKPEAPPCTRETLRLARAQFALPLLAIGGITPDNGAPLIADGANMLAAISGVFAQDDIEASARRYANLFS